MYFYNLIEELSKENKIDLFVDMDGVIASYDFGHPLDFKNKRPLKTNIETLGRVSQINNVELYILSVCRKDFQIKDKNDWLDKNAPFFKKENRVILSKETIINKTSPQLKSDYFKNYKTDNKVILLDDDNSVLSLISKEVDNILLLQDSELID